MRKRILALALALIMTLGLLNVTALAVDTHTGHSGWSAVSTFHDSMSGSYYLESDVTLTSAWTLGSDVNLCLNGHTLTLAAKITVSKGKKLTITDCGTTKGKILRADTNTSENALLEVFGTLEANGITIDGGNITYSTSSYAAIFVRGTLTMQDCTIQNCKKDGNYGGAILLKKADGSNTHPGSATLTNCVLQNNQVTKYGGAIYVGEGTTLTMTNGSLKNNKTTSSSMFGGGAIYNKGTVNLNGVTLMNNTSTYGGAIYNSSYGTLTVIGGSISGNTATAMAYGRAAGNGIFHSSRTNVSGGSKLTIGENANIADQIFLDVGYAVKDVILKAALVNPLYLVGGGAKEGRVIAEGTDTYTITEADMNHITVAGWNLKLEENKIKLTKQRQEDAYLLVQLTTDNKDLNVTLKQGDTTTQLHYDEGAGAYVGNVKPGEYTVYVEGIKNPTQTIKVETNSPSNNIFSLKLPGVTIIYASDGSPVTTAKVGETLKAVVTNPPEGATLYYQWCYDDDDTTKPLEGDDTTYVTYTLKDAEAGKTISVLVYDGPYNKDTNSRPIGSAWVKVADLNTDRTPEELTTDDLGWLAGIFPVYDREPFDDVTTRDWFYDDVHYVNDHGLMTGTGYRIFSPEAPVTRGMVMTILARREGIKTERYSPWYAAGVEWAVANGISDGSNPEAPITREELVTILYRYTKIKGYDLSSSALTGFSDASSISGYAVSAMQWAVNSGLINGAAGVNAGKLLPQSTATRAQLAAMLHRFFG